MAGQATKARTQSRLPQESAWQTSTRKSFCAVSVGNEILVSWSDHQLTEEKATEYVAQVKKAVRCPVTVADDFIYWRQQTKLAEHVDFITMHAYPIWGREDIDTAMASTIKDYESVCKAHPGKTIVLGEAGWASFTAGDQHVPRAGDEKKQKMYYEELTAWAKANNVTTFYFEAFDEPWKGDGTEGHWGLFSADRKAKLALQGLVSGIDAVWANIAELRFTVCGKVEQLFAASNWEGIFTKDRQLTGS